jgi:hypothetical protein
MFLRNIIVEVLIQTEKSWYYPRMLLRYFLNSHQHFKPYVAMFYAQVSALF